MDDMDHLREAREALAAARAVPQGRDLPFVQAQATLALAHAAMALVQRLRLPTHTPSEAPADAAEKTPSASELGNPVQVVTVKLRSGVYHLERYANNTVLALNANIPRYEEVTKPVLRRINDELNLNVDLYRPNGALKNTRTLGRDVMRAVVEQKKGIPQRGARGRSPHA